MRILLISMAFLLLSQSAHAARAVMEGIRATKATILIDTGTARVHIGTGSYVGGIANTGLFVSSNVVLGSNNAQNNIVLYASGSIVTPTLIVGGSAISPPSTGYAFVAANQRFTGTNAFDGNTNLGQVLIASGAFGTTSTMTLTFAALPVGVYQLTVAIAKDGTAQPVLLRFNNDPGANYDGSNTYTGTDGVNGADSGADTSSCYIGRSGVSVAANGTAMGSWTLFVGIADQTYIVGSGSVNQQTGANTWYVLSTSCKYDGANLISQANVTTASGNIEGYIYLVKIQ